MSIQVICGMVGIASGLAHLVVPIIKKQKMLRWASTAFLLAGILWIAWGTFVVLTTPSLAIFNKEVCRQLYYKRASIGGVAAGITLTLFMAGQFKLSAWNEHPVEKDETNRDN